MSILEKASHLHLLCGKDVAALLGAWSPTSHRGLRQLSAAAQFGSIEIKREIDTGQVTPCVVSPGSYASEICRAEQNQQIFEERQGEKSSMPFVHVVAVE